MSKNKKRSNNSKSNTNVNVLLESEAKETQAVVTEQSVQPSLADIMNAITGLSSSVNILASRVVALECKGDNKENPSSNDFQTPIQQSENVNATTNISTPPNRSLVFENSNNTHSTIVNQINTNRDTVKMHSAVKSISNNNRDLVDKDLHPILNIKLELDVSNAPKLSRSLSADEYINWYNKLKNIVLSNPRFMFLFNNPAETAWKLCGGELWTGNLLNNDLDLYRWEASFISSIRYLYMFITQLVPEDIVNGIRLHMVKDRGKYNIATRLGFRSNVVLQVNQSKEPFYQDVFNFMQLLEQRYNTKDCNRLLELVKVFNAIKLDKVEHPQTIFMEYQETVDRIKSVYPEYPEPNESWMCFDILTRLPKLYDNAVKELFRSKVEDLKKDEVIKRLIAEYVQICFDTDVRGQEAVLDSLDESQHIAAAAIKKLYKPNAERICYNCGKTGHIAKQCTVQKKSNDFSEDESNYVEPVFEEAQMYYCEESKFSSIKSYLVDYKPP